MSTTDAHEKATARINEYLAAISHLHEQTPSPRVLAEGQEVSGVAAGRRWTGTLQSVDGDRCVVEVPGAWLAVSVRDID